MLNTLLFSPEEDIPAAGLTILAIVYQGPMKRDTRYLVRVSCCGSEIILAHRTIRKRMHAVRHYCQRCGSKHRNRYADDGLPQIMRAQAFLPADILPAGCAWPRPTNTAPARVWRAQA